MQEEQVASNEAKHREFGPFFSFKGEELLGTNLRLYSLWRNSRLDKPRFVQNTFFLMLLPLFSVCFLLHSIE